MTPLIRRSVKQCAAALLPLTNGQLADKVQADRAAAAAWAAHIEAAAAFDALESAGWAAQSAARAAESAALSLSDHAASAEMAVTALRAAISRSRDYVTVSEKLLELLEGFGLG